MNSVTNRSRFAEKRYMDKLKNIKKIRLKFKKTQKAKSRN